MERFTVLIANHNYGKWIKTAIESALNQTYENKSVIVIDDGSTDNSAEVIGSFGDKVTAVYVKDSKGPSYARNQGIKYTWDKTDFWAVLDADDEMYPTKLEKFAEKLKNPVGICYADYENFNDETPSVLVREHKEPYSKLRLMQECIIHSGAAFSKEAVIHANVDKDHVYNEALRCAEDWDLWLKLSRASLGYHISESLTKVRIHGNNATNSVKQEVWNQCWKYIQQNLQAGVYN